MLSDFASDVISASFYISLPDMVGIAYSVDICTLSFCIIFYLVRIQNSVSLQPRVTS